MTATPDAAAAGGLIALRGHVMQQRAAAVTYPPPPRPAPSARLVHKLRGVPRLRRPPRGAELPVQSVRHRVPASLAGVPGPQDGAHAGVCLERGHVHAAPGEEEERHGGSRGDGVENLGDELSLRVGCVGDRDRDGIHE